MAVSSLLPIAQPAGPRQLALPSAEPATPPRFPPAPLLAFGARLRRNLACQDWVLLAFHGYMWIRASTAPPSALTSVAAPFMAGLFASVALVIAITRGELVRDRSARVLLYRFGILATTVLSYLGLRYHLAGLAPTLLDAELLAIDRRLFGVTPAVALDRFVTPTTVEWFAFFYYLHFFVIALHVLGTLTLDAGRRRYELLFGTLLVACLGHTIYTLVPGLGPYAVFPELFQHELSGGLFWREVQQAVTVAGAQLDIFPSLHTAFPTFFTLHALRHRRTRPYRSTWLPTLLVTLNIVVATVFLRWHYGVDLIAGALLAVVAQRLAIVLFEPDQARMARGGQSVWESTVIETMDAPARRWLLGVMLINTGMLAVTFLVTHC